MLSWTTRDNRHRGSFVHRTAIIAGSVVATLATGGLLAVNGGAQAPGGQTIKLVTKNFQFKAIDVAPRERSRESSGRGDSFVLSGVVTNEAGARTGSIDVTCTATVGGRNGRAVCDGAYSLREGAIYITTVFKNSSEGNVIGAVIGGTRAYAGARGTFASVDRPGERGGDPSDETITLLP